MQPNDMNLLANLTADIVEARLSAKGGTKASCEADRLAQLRADLETLSLQFSARDQVIAQVRAEVAEHGFLVDKSDDSGRPGVERLRPPQFGPQGPSDDDIQREIDELMRKIDRLRRPQPGEEYEYKLPFRVQINVAFLVSILLELLKLILKLLARQRHG